MDIPWHRCYQQFAEMNNHESALVALYDKYLAAEPSSAALIYLRGRIDPDWEKQESFYRRAIAADPKLGWPWLGIAARASARRAVGRVSQGGSQGARAERQRTGNA